MKHHFDSYFLDSPLQGGRVFDVFKPEGIPRDRAIFFIHGGGWSAGSRTVYYKVMEKLCEMGFICASTDYRLSSPGRNNIHALDQLKDIREAYDAFVSLLKEWNRSLRIVTHGGSAGAHLNALLSFAAPGACGEKCELKNEWVKPEKVILQATPMQFEPWADIFPAVWGEMQNCAAGCSYESDPEIFRRLSPKNYLNEKSPVSFFIEAGNEHMFPPEMNFAVVEKMRSMGIDSQWKIYPTAEHGFIYDLSRRVQQEAFADIVAFLEDRPIVGGR